MKQCRNTAVHEGKKKKKELKLQKVNIPEVTVRMQLLNAVNLDEKSQPVLTALNYEKRDSMFSQMTRNF